MSNKIKIIFLSVLGLCSLTAHAETATNNIKASASLSGVCYLNVSDVNFGEYNPVATTHQITTQDVSIKCTKGTSWSFNILNYNYSSSSEGDNSTGYISQMVFNGNKLNYQMQLSDGMWDNDIESGGHPNNGNFVGIGSGQEQKISTKFRILKNQYVPPGNYTDSAIANVTF